ncbi:MAG: ATP-binding protein [Acidimicrobiia bacterium]|nr:ATP-binding protein [Acidimicrobiia bacterium]
MTHLARMRRSRLVVGIIVLGTIGTAIASAMVQRRADANAEEWVNERAVLVADATKATVGELVTGVEAVAALVETTNDLTQEHFTAFVSRLDPRLNKIGIAYVPVVQREDTSAFIEMMRLTVPDYAFSGLDPFTGLEVELSGDADVHYPVQFFAPGTFLTEKLPEHSPLEIGIGVDAAASPTFAAVIDETLQTGTSTVSSFIPISYGDVSIGQAFVVVTPVHPPDTSSPSGAVAAIMIDWLLQTDLAGAITQEIEWKVGPLDGQSGRLDTTAAWVGALELPGATWQLDLEPTESVEQRLAGTPSWLVWAIGLSLTAGIAGFAHLYRLRARSRARISEMQRVSEEKDRFLAAVSHEIRTPLTAVAGLAHELSERPDDFDGTEFRSLLGTVAEQSDEVAAIVEDLLVAARSDIDNITVHLGTIDLQTELALAIESAGVEAEVIGEYPPDAWADAQRVRQILRNLLTNADRYGGPDIQVRFRADQARVSITVADNGRPIPEEQRRRIFEPYTSAHEDREQVGSIGLGLFISRTLAALMEGSLDYDHDGEWSMFTLSVPRSNTASHQPTPPAPTNLVSGEAEEDRRKSA